MGKRAGAHTQANRDLRETTIGRQQILELDDWPSAGCRYSSKMSKTWENVHTRFDAKEVGAGNVDNAV